MASARSAVIVGAGISGLSVAHALLRKGVCESLRLYSAEAPQYTTSTVAGGLIEPAYVAAADTDVGRWFSSSRALLRTWLDQPDWHVLRAQTCVFWRTAEPAPGWAALVDDFAVQQISRDPYTHAWRYNTEVVEAPLHIAALLRCLEARGVTIAHRRISALDELKPEADLIINCSGVGARALGDLSVASISGQVIILERDARIPAQVVIDEAPLTYVIPRCRDVVVGGTFVAGDWNRVPHIGVAQQIMQRAIRLVPELAFARVLAHRVGLRPARPRPRLEIEAASVESGGPIIAHCYGAGGAGFGLAYGMASELVDRIAALALQ